MYPAVFINLLRDSSVEKSDTDDRIVIRRVDANIHVTNYNQLNCPGQRAKGVKSVLTDSSLSRYIRTLLKSLCMDQDAFLSVQIAFPGFPDVLIAVNRLSNERIDTLVSMAKITMEAWFSDSVTDSDSETDSEADSESDSDSTESDTSSDTDSTDSDMPPLMSQHEYFHF